MSEIIRAYANKNKPIIDDSHPLLHLTYFNLIRLRKGEKYFAQVQDFELVYVVLSGKCDIHAGVETFAGIGQRRDIWSGKADSVYVTVSAPVKVTALEDHTEIAVAGGYSTIKYPSFRIAPEEVDLVDVGSGETHSRRRIFHILGQNTLGRSGNLLVSELYADGGCWSGYPPHKHDTDVKNDDGTFEETGFEETYHFRFLPETGFGAQFVFDTDKDPHVYMTRNGDTVVIEKGYHPTVTSPGHQEYIFTILCGHTQRSLIQYFKEEHRHLMNTIPGIAQMRAKFK